MKYDSLIGEVQRALPISQNVLIALPSNASVDQLASGLALYLALKSQNKFVVVASESTIRVSHTNLYGIDKIQTDISANGIGNFVLTIGGAVDPAGKPIFEKVDYSLEGSDLKLIFPIVPGNRFEATHITPKFEGGNFDLIFTLGLQKLENLGKLYSDHQDIFNTAHIINVDRSSDNSGFGTTKVIDSSASSLSEMVGQLIPALNLKLDSDSATNLLAGISEATNNLQTNVGAETFEVVANCLRNGGQKQGAVGGSEQAAVQQTVVPAEAGTQSNLDPGSSPGMTSDMSSQSGPTFDFTQMYQPNPEPFTPPDESPQQDNFTVPPVVDSGATTHEREISSESTQSGYESEVEVTPEDDWLTPKVFSGKSLG